MDPCKNNAPECNPDLCINMPKEYAPRNSGCKNEPKKEPATGKHSECCTLSPIVHTPLLKPCDVCNRNACGQQNSVVGQDPGIRELSNTVVLANNCPPPAQPKPVPAGVTTDCYPTSKQVMQVDPCKTQPCDDKCCITIRDCVNCELTDYGKEFAQNTGKMVSHCQCVKFNGLQDSCRHPGCGTKHNCLDGKCSPAQKWKCEFVCKNRKKNDCDS